MVANADVNQAFSQHALILSIFFPLYIFGVASCIGLLVIYYRRRTRFPIRGRHVWLVMCTFTSAIIWIAIVGGLPVLGALLDRQLPCEAHRILTTLAVHVFMIFGLSTFTVRVFCLFFAFEISLIKAKHLTTLDSAMDPALEWFVDRRHWVSKKFLGNTAFFLFSTHLVETLIQLTAVSGQRCGRTDLGVDANSQGEAWDSGFANSVTGVLVLFYSGIAIYFAHKYRNFESDMYKIRREVALTGYLALGVLIFWVAFSFVPPFVGYSDTVFPFDRFVLLIGAVSFGAIQLGFPIYESYKKEHKYAAQHKEARRTRSHSQTSYFTSGGVSRVDQLRALLKHDEVFSAFFHYLTKEFAVENIVFWSECETFKEDCLVDPAADVAALARRASELEQNFLHADALMEVNVSHNIRRQVSVRIRELAGAASPPSPAQFATIFEEATEQIFKLMARDSFPRFLRTPAFQTLLKEGKRRVDWADGVLLGSPTGGAQSPRGHHVLEDLELAAPQGRRQIVEMPKKPASLNPNSHLSVPLSSQRRESGSRSADSYSVSADGSSLA